jgi:tetratricopeptide (TPR) repeat protein
MRDSLSKRTKSLSTSSLATLKRSRKLSSTKSANVSSRQKSTLKTATKKNVKALPPSKGEKKTNLAKKKISSEKTKKAVAPPAKIAAAKKSPAKKLSKPVKVTSKVVSKIAKPKVKIQATVPKISSPASKPVISSPRIPRQQNATQALRAFERAVKVFNLRQFSEAKALFEELQQRYHQEVEIISRSQTYIQVCTLRLAGNRTLPRNADEFYDRGVVALNVGNFAQARTFFEKALKLRPDDSHTLYSLAATHAQTGSTDQALTYLRQAVQRQPRLRQRALQDADFSILKDDRRFLELLGAASPFDLLGTRRDIP